MPLPLPPPSQQRLIPPLLASLPAAAVSSQPPAPLLPILSPILRQRVQLLSADTKDPWLPLLCYDPSKAKKLSQTVQSDKFEPHPVSGEIEVDWENEVEIRFRRVDQESLEAYISLREFDLSVKLLWCTGDQGGGGDGWRVSEVNTLDAYSEQNKWDSIGEAEWHFKEAISGDTRPRGLNSLQRDHMLDSNAQSTVSIDEDDEDDAYWAQYDNTPARTPAVKLSPAPESMPNGPGSTTRSAEDAYYAQYASVQAAIDNHDPDEASQHGPTEPTLNGNTLTYSLQNGASLHHSYANANNHYANHDPEKHLSSSSHIWASSLLPTTGDDPSSYTSLAPFVQSHGNDSINTATTTTADTEPSSEVEVEGALPQPRPTSSSSSSSTRTVEKLESTATALGQSEMGVKQHISTSVKSLYRLARAAGLERAEFERLVRTELEVLCLIDEDEV